MTTYILEEYRTPEKVILAEKVVGADRAFTPFRVKTTETKCFTTKKECMDYFKKAQEK